MRNFEERVDDREKVQTLICVSDLYKEYVNQCPDPESALINSLFGKYLAVQFPCVRVTRKTLIGDDHSTHYYDKLRRIKDNTKTANDAITDLVQKYNMILAELDSFANNYRLILIKECRGSKVYLEIKLNNGCLGISCGDTNINLQNLHFGDTIDMDYKGISAIGKFLANITICTGVEYTSNSHSIAGSVVTEIDVSKTRKYLRSISCTKIVNITGYTEACHKCKQAESHCKKKC